MTERKKTILDQIKKRAYEVWQNQQSRKEINDFVLPKLEKSAAIVAQGVQTSGLAVPEIERHLNEINELVQTLRTVNKQSYDASHELGAAMGHLQEQGISDTEQRDISAHLATFTENLPIFLAGDPGIWEYMLVLVDIPIYQEACEALEIERLKALRDATEFVISIKETLVSDEE